MLFQSLLMKQGAICCVPNFQIKCYNPIPINQSLNAVIEMGILRNSGLRVIPCHAERKEEEYDAFDIQKSLPHGREIRLGFSSRRKLAIEERG